MNYTKFRGYDAAFIMKQISGQAVRDGLTNEFMSDEDINEWLRIYKENLNDDTVTHEELLFEVNLMLPSVCLSKFFSRRWIWNFDDRFSDIVINILLLAIKILGE